MSYSSDKKTSGLRVALALSALVSMGVTASGCIEDADCGICDPDNLILESISGINYTSDKIHILNPPCQGDRCPGAFSKGTYFIEEIGPCEQTEEALATPDEAEYCKISPLVTAFGVEFVFNNLLDPQSIELVRKRPDNPQLFEVYDWKSDVLHIEGPITRFNGDYVRGGREAPDVITRMVNLSCVENLREQGVEFGHEDYQDPATNPCNQIIGDKPQKMDPEGSLHAYRGIWSSFGNSCSSPEEGPDTCCTFCEWLLTSSVERYGLGVEPETQAVLPRNPLGNDPTLLAAINPGGAQNFMPALQCRTGESDGIPRDKYSLCSSFIVSVDRSQEEQRWEYAWCTPGTVGPDCPMEVQQFPVPMADLLRETHPDERPRGIEKLISPCRTTADCGEDGHNLSGTECMGVNDDTGATCLADAYPEGGCSREGDGGNVGGFCRPQWMVICAENSDTTGGEAAYCMDRRYGTTGSAACKRTTGDVESPNFGGLAGYRVGCDDDGTNCVGRAGGGSELALCDWNENGRLTGPECCNTSIAFSSEASGLPSDGEFNCDPFYQLNLTQKPIYQRDQNLPDQTKNCRCPDSGTRESNREDLEESSCFEAADIGCFDDDGNLREERAGQYAVKFVTRRGGVVYDPAIKGFDWRAADVGGVPRADIEECAEGNVDRLVAALNRHDGWRANDPFTPENFEDFDRAMCSGQEYKVVFEEPNENGDAYVVDKVGNTLESKSVYTFETPQFHMVPGSGFPTDNLRIGACDDFSIRFSNKYDVSPENLEKLQLFRVTCEEDEVSAGSNRTCELAPPDPRCERDIDGDGVADPPPGACCDANQPVAGGPGCAATEDELLSQGACGRPCLTVDVENQFIGEVGVEIDSTEFGQVLVENEVYRMIVPAAGTLDAASADPTIYTAVFWDICGMPLVTENAVPYTYEFKIDEPKCKEDQDRDGIPFSCDNADTNFNPTQADIDADGIGDIVDLCPVAGGDTNNTADSDDDGVGNVCDNCRQTLDQYNAGADLANVPVYLQVRNIPFQDDADDDGIGDVCDNCIHVPNCESYGNEAPLTPYEVADPIRYNDDDVCQRDVDGDAVGDACAGMMMDGAAGIVGFGPEDDFDQDGIGNMLDGCPRQPLQDRIDCTPAGNECGEGRNCTNGICNHIDSDSDGVGNQCDTCAFSPNSMQDEEGGMQEDDPDSDFVGAACETAPGCNERKDPRPFAFFPVQANGNCCVSLLAEANEEVVDLETGEVISSVGDLMLSATCESSEVISATTCTPLEAPHPEDPARNLPVRTAENCPEEQVGGEWLCRQLPAEVAPDPGILTPPPGCDEALASFGDGITALDNLLSPLTDRDFGNEPNPFDALWSRQCFMPQVDQDFDGLGDKCDLCPFDFDPGNTQFIDQNGRLWPNDGAFCNGDYLIDNRCELLDMGDTGDEPTGGSGSTGGGSSGGSGGEAEEGGSGG